MYKSKVRSRSVHTRAQVVERKKPARLRQVRKRRRFVFVIVGCTLLLFAGIGVLWGAHHSYFDVRTLTITGAQVLNAEDIKSTAMKYLFDERFHVVPQTNIWLVPRDAVREYLLYTFPRLQHATVSIEAWDVRALRIDVVERTPFGAWCPQAIGEAEHTCYLLDESGFLFAPAESIYPGIYFSGELSYSAAPRDENAAPIRASFAPEYMPSVKTLLTIIAQNGFAPTRVFFDGVDVFIETEQLTQLRFSLSQSSSEAEINFTSALASEELAQRLTELEYIDMRFGERVYYKFKDEELGTRN